MSHPFLWHVITLRSQIIQHVYPWSLLHNLSSLETTQVKYLFSENIFLVEPDYGTNLKDILFSTKLSFLAKQGKKKLNFANVLNIRKNSFMLWTSDNFST